MRCLVTGGLGFIGSYVARKLHEKGYTVTIFDDGSNACGIAQIPKKVSIIYGTILDGYRFRDAVRNSDVVFHLAVRSLPESLENPRNVLVTNADGTYNICEACAEEKKPLMYLSSSEVYGDSKIPKIDENQPLRPHTVYSASKACGELFVYTFHVMHEMPFLVIRPFNTYGPLMRADRYGAVFPNFAQRLSMGLAPIIYGDGKQARDFTYVEDTANGIILAFEKISAIENTVINIGTGNASSINELARLFMKSFNFDGEPIHTAPRKGDSMRLVADTTRARRLIGYNPTVRLSEGISLYVSWFNKTQKNNSRTTP